MLQRPGLGEAIPNRPAPSNGGAMGVAPGDGQTHGEGKGEGRNKTKKTPNLMKRFAGKVSTLSSKITELKCVQTQIQSCDLLYLGNKLIWICLVKKTIWASLMTAVKICF